MIERAGERLVQCRFLLDLMQALTRLDVMPSGARIENILVLAAVCLGSLEGRPFSATKLADYMKMPRQTVQRRLADLLAQNYIVRRKDGRYIGNPDRLNSAESLAVTESVSVLIRRTAAALDNDPSAPQAPQ